MLLDILVGDDSLPEAVEVEGGLYPVLTDFRYWMRVESNLLDGAITDEHKTIFLLSAFMPSVAVGLIQQDAGYPFAVENGIAALNLFYAGGEERRDKKGKDGASAATAKQERTYDFKHDIGLIYAAFRATYGIDLMLRDTKMHWWVFRALFMGLPDGAAIRRLMEARAMKLGKKPTKEQRDAKEAVALPEEIRWLGGGGRRGVESIDAWAERIRARKEAGG